MMLMLRIKQSQCALAEGRLEEAFGLLQDDQLRQHRQGQQLISDLIKAYTERGREHLSAGRTADAWADACQAHKLAGADPEVVTLREDVAKAMTDQRNDQQRHVSQKERMREYISKGWLSAAGEMLEKTPVTDSVLALKELAETKKLELQAAARKVQDAIAGEDIKTAAELIATLGNQVDENWTAARKAFEQYVGERLRSLLAEGRLGQARRLADELAGLTWRNADVQELVEIPRRLEQLATWAAAGAYQRAAVALERIAALLGKTPWIAEAVTQLRAAAGAMEKLHAGPLSDLLGSTTSTEEIVTPLTKETPTIPLPRFEVTTRPTTLPERFVLQVDGAGSFLVLTRPDVTIGPVSASPAADIGLVTSPDVPMTRIERHDDDYFFVRNGSGKMASIPQEELLHDGGKLVLSPRCSVRFHRPNPASTTAVLNLDAARLPRADIRRVLLLDREFVVGPQPAAHIRTAANGLAAVFYLAADGLHVKTSQPVTIGGQAASAQTALPLEKPITINDVTIVIQPYM